MKRAYTSDYAALVGVPVARKQMVVKGVVPRKRFSKRGRYELIPGNFGRYNKLPSNNELKFFDTTLAFTYDATGEVPATGQITLIPQGVTESTRVGRKCVIKSIWIRGTNILVPAADTVGSSECYLFVMLDKQCNGAAAAIGDSLTGTNMATAMPNLENSDRFQVLKKLRFNMTAQAGVQGAFARKSVPIDCYIKCNIPIEYDSSAATGALTTIRSNNIYLLAGTDGGSDDLVSFAGTCRLRFQD